MSLLNDALIQAAPEYESLFKEAPQAAQFYDDLADHYRSQLAPNEVGIVIANNTTQAFEKRMAERGFFVFSPNHVPLTQKDGEIWLQEAGESHRVGLVHLDMEASSLDYYGWGILLSQAYYAGNVKLSTPPLGQIMMDKRFLPFIGRMIEFYLGETPLIPPPVSKILKVEQFDELVQNGKIVNYVVKSGTGRGGCDVYLGPNIVADIKIAEKIRRKLTMAPRDQVVAILQRMAIIGTRDGMQTDIRPITYVDEATTITTPVPWSRSSGVGEKSNITKRNGKSVQNAVLILAPRCSEVLSLPY